MKILFLVLGACFGSFFSVCIYRIPRKKSIISPPSHCPQCNRTIKWYDNIPIFSHCLLQGKCRFCNEKIPLSYLAVELITAIVFLATYLKFGLSIKLPVHLAFFSAGEASVSITVPLSSIKLLVHLAFFSMLIVGSFIDAEWEILPDIITIPGIILGLLVSSFTIGILSSVLGGAVGAVVVGFFAILGRLLFKKEAMGGGDIKLLAMIGCFTGWVNALWVIFLASIIGLIFGLIRRQYRLPFGPFLSVASFIIVIIGNPSSLLFA